MASGWIMEENLKPFLEVVAFLAECELDEDDWIAIEYGIRDTNIERDIWFTYPDFGSREFTVRAADDPGSGIVWAAVDKDGGLPPELKAQLRVLFWMCQGYDIQQYRQKGTRLVP